MLTPEGTISLFNANTFVSPTGSVTNITGTAYPTEEPGQLTVVFDPSPDFNPPPFPAPYWVVGLGPMNAANDNKYDWAIVSDDNMLSLFVLARDVAQFNVEYNAEVQATLKTLGFTKITNKPIPTTQTPDCNYAPFPFPDESA